VHALLGKAVDGVSRVPAQRARRLEVGGGVGGRNKVTFDDMVRMDLQYAKSWTLWLDVKILLKTPRAAVMGI
jgi:lipopolysaccharide/colanic/teichoic acid biosynthesis glycosyltransferase